MISLLGTLTLHAQKAEELFNNGDYYNAALFYEQEVKSQPEKYLKLAECYMSLERYVDAKNAYKKYITEYNGAEAERVKSLIKILERNDPPVEMRPVASINTTSGEYSPLVSKDGNRLYFTGYKREGGLGNEDIFYATKQKDGTWSQATPFTEFNTKSSEGLKGLNEGNDVAILFGNYSGSFGGGDLFYSLKENGSWMEPCNLGGSINTDEFEAMANLSANGKYLLFVSDRDGNRDIYFSQISEQGWSKPINLGDVVNTSSTEATPMLAADNRTLYFSSDGHHGFGKYDIFMSKRLDDTWTNWSEPVNLGKYINTIDDDYYLSIPSQGTRGYLPRKGGIASDNSKDIYEFILPPNLRPQTYINVYGTVKDSKDSTAEVLIRYLDFNTNEEVAVTASNGIDGNYALSLPANKKYKVLVNMKGFIYYETVLDLTDMSKFYPSRSFKQVLADDFKDLEGIRKDFTKYDNEFGSLINSPVGVDVDSVFNELLGLSNLYEGNSLEMKQLLTEARYRYLTELENMRVVSQNHQVKRIEVGTKFEVKDLFFASGEATLTPESESELQKLFEILNRTEIVIELAGHTDNVGDDENNMKLSQARVESVKSYLVNRGIDPRRMNAKGYGESEPIADNETPEGRQANRRVELEVKSLRLQEGNGVIDGNEELDGLKDGLATLDTNEIDLKHMFREAALNGGLPKGAACSNTPIANNGNLGNLGGGTITPGGIEVLNKSNYVYRTFNPFVANFSYRNQSDMLGAGLHFMNDDLREWYISAYQSTDDRVTGMGQFGVLHAVQLSDIFNVPLNFHFGLDAALTIYEETTPGERPNPGFFSTIPMGLRYVHDMGDIKIGPEAFYHMALLTSDNLEEKSTYWRFGVNARYRFLHAGLFYNTGDLIKYPGFRLGFSF
ncbi:MAG: OmpA family protein [Bacteroidetes bacterium]|nr:OmpA family protein [Bacteroidota bacterium]